ncbi:MAG TPA: molecular chaperone DnaK [Abditibacteriaceae bacterium]|jgi:chaperone protein DnaK
MATAVGIDLGTTNSVVAAMDNGQPRAIAENGRTIVPSVVLFREDGQTLVGDEAREHQVENAARTVFSAKRLMGRSFADVADDISSLPYRVVDTGKLAAVEIDGRHLTAPEISATILRALKMRAENYLKTDVTSAVITVPAYFNDAQRQATRDAGRIAGLNVLRMINEPTAAAIAYGLDKEERGAIAVYDLGGGTFDISVLDRREGALDVRAVGGDTHLGGDDFDRTLQQYLGARVQRETGVDALANATAAQRLRRAAEDVKIALSSAPETHIGLAFPELDGLEWNVEISREEFETLIAPIVQRTVAPCLDALKESGYVRGEIGAVALVGGSTRVPLVQRVVKEIFGVEPRTDLDPDEVVALGAAVQAGVLSGGISLAMTPVVLDVTPLSLGVEAYGGGTVKLLPRNAKIPAFAREEFTTAVDNQTSIDVHVVQGERERAADNRSLARFKLPITPQPAGLPRVQVTYLIDANGILNVSAKDLRGNSEQQIQVQPTYGLTDDEVDAMMRAAFENAKEDRALAAFHHEARAAELTLASTEKELARATTLDDATRSEIEVAAQAVRDALQTKDAATVTAAARQLDTATRPLAEQLMNAVVEKVKE